MRSALILAVLLLIMPLIMPLSVSQPLLFLGDVSNLTPLECIDRQCGLAGQACARNCPASFTELSCKAECSAVMSRCLQSRCFFSLHKVLRAKAHCCELNKWGCVYNENKGCIDTTDQPCAKNKGFQEFYDRCMNANLSAEQGNATLNVSSQELPRLNGTGPCIDISECKASQVCYAGSCVEVGLISPNHRHAVECLDDADCPSSKLARFVCLNSSCVLPPEGFCRSSAECGRDGVCTSLQCVVPERQQQELPPAPPDPAVAALASWARGRQGIMAQVAAVAGYVSDRSKEPNPGSVLSEGSTMASPQEMAVELALADGSRAFLGPDTFVVLSSITAQGTALQVVLEVGRGELILDVPQVQEVQHEVRVQAKGVSVRMHQGAASVVVYADGASKIAVMEQKGYVGDLEVPQGYQVRVDPVGHVRPQEAIPPAELKRLQTARTAPTLVRPPPFEEALWFEQYAVQLVVVLLVAVAAVWILVKARSGKGRKDSGGDSKIEWPELEGEKKH